MVYVIGIGVFLIVGFIVWPMIEAYRIRLANKRWREEKRELMQKTATALGGNIDEMMEGNYTNCYQEGNK